MATKEVIWDLVSLMASMWSFPGKDLKMTAEGYHLALRDLSDEDAKEAVTALASEWTKATAPKPADILATAKAFKRTSNVLHRLPQNGPSRDEITRKLHCDTYHIKAIIEVIGEHKPFKRWTEDEKRKVAKRQAEMRAELGLTPSHT